MVLARRQDTVDAPQQLRVPVGGRVPKKREKPLQKKDAWSWGVAPTGREPLERPKGRQVVVVAYADVRAASHLISLHSTSEQVVAAHRVQRVRLQANGKLQQRSLEARGESTTSHLG